jgi:glutathione S-transferase
LHPIVRGLANPLRMTDGDGEPVRAMARKLAKKSFGLADYHLAENGWWLGEWSIIDVYLDWATSVARNAGFDLSPFPALDGLRHRLMDHPAYARTQDINERAKQELAARVTA